MRRTVAVVVALGMAVGGGWRMARADGFPGGGSLAGRVKLKVRGCGKVKSDVAIDAAVDAGGAWRLDEGPLTVAGTGAIGGRGRRRLVLTPDEAGLAAWVAALEDRASALCGVPVSASGASLRKAVLAVNGKGARARLVIVLKATASSEDGERSATSRIKAVGAWAGPLSCDEIFVCTRTCTIGDGACVAACLAQGTLATQAVVEALNGCVDALCPLRDPVCVADVLGGVCRDEYEACVPPPPPTDLTCEEILDCAAACEREGCVADCFDRGTQRGRAEATAVSSCLARVCPNGGAACGASALAGACAYVWEDCTGTPPPRNLGCDAILDCWTTCAAGDAACLTDCRDRGSATGVARLDDLDACIDAACPTRDPQCVANTVTGQCRAEWEICFS